MADLTDEFDRRLAVIDKAGRTVERDAAILLYERLKTSISISQALLAQPADASALVAMALELGRLADGLQAEHGSRSDE